MQQYFNQTFNADLAVGLYMMYRDGSQEALEDLLKELLSLIRWVSRTHARGRGANREYLEANALYALYKLVQSADLPTHPKAFKSYLFTVVRRSYLRSLQWMKPQEFDLSDVGSQPFVGRLPTYRDVDARIYRQQILDYVRKFVHEKVRFSSAERSVCLKLAEAIIENSRVNEVQLLTGSKLCRSRFNAVKRHAHILVRWGFEEARLQ